MKKLRKKEGRMVKKLEVKKVNCVLQLLIGPVRHAAGYHSEISHHALWYE